jgi:hypothetical protein
MIGNIEGAIGACCGKSTGFGSIFGDGGEAFILEEEEEEEMIGRAGILKARVVRGEKICKGLSRSESEGTGADSAYGGGIMMTSKEREGYRDGGHRGGLEVVASRGALGEGIVGNVG